MAKYKVLEKSYIDGRIYEAGDICEYAGQPGSKLEPLAEVSEAEDKAPKPKAKAETA